MSPEQIAEEILTAHQRHRGGCLCGWAELGKSHPGHQVAMLRAAGLLNAALAAVEQDRDQWRNRCDGQAWADLEQDRDRLQAELTATRGNRLISAIFGHHKGAPRPFALYRSGEVRESGLIALGAEFPDGAVALRLANYGGWTTKSDGGAEGITPSYATVVWLSDELESLAEMEQDRDRLAKLVEQYAPIAVPILADMKARKERSARLAAHTHYCWTCSNGTTPGDGCHNCRNTGMDQTPCVGCPGPRPVSPHALPTDTGSQP